MRVGFSCLEFQAYLFCLDVRIYLHQDPSLNLLALRVYDILILIYIETRVEMSVHWLETVAFRFRCD